MGNDDDDMLDHAIERLVTIKLRLGAHVYRDAAQGALSAIARAAMAEGERLSKRARCVDDNVVLFPQRRKSEG